MALKHPQPNPYPDQLFVRFEPEDDGEGYFTPARHPREHATPDGRTRIAIYVLERVVDVAADVKVVEPS